MELDALASIVAPYSKEIVALLLSVVGTFSARLLQPKAKLIHSVRHRFHYLIPEPLRGPDGKIISQTQSVSVVSLAVSNTGRSTATSVELVFNWKPPYFNVWPLRHYTILDHPDRRFSLILESLAPKEAFGMELLSINRDLPELCNVRSEQTQSVEKIMIPQMVHPRWIMGLVAWLMFAGLVTTIYLLLVLIEWGVG